MGTRHLIMVVREQKPVIAQYGQWDGYPSGQGYTVLEFLRKFNRPTFVEKLKNVRFVNKKDTATLYNKKYPYMSRDHGAEILEMVYNSDGEVLLNDHSDFAGDSLFCEWAYVIDLDNNVLECYSGFNKEPLEEDQRFRNTEVEKDSEWLPIKCLKKYSLDELPTNEQFVKDLEKEEEE